MTIPQAVNEVEVERLEAGAADDAEIDLLLASLREQTLTRDDDNDHDDDDDNDDDVDVGNAILCCEGRSRRLLILMSALCANKRKFNDKVTYYYV
jgi:hypothetical protein